MHKIFPIVKKAVSAALVAWGPDFGESSDDNTFTVAVALAFTDLAAEFNLVAQSALTMPTLVIDYGSIVNVPAVITSTDLAANYGSIVNVPAKFDQGGGKVYDAAADYGSIANGKSVIADDVGWCVGASPPISTSGLFPTKDVTVIVGTATNQNTLTTLIVQAASTTPPTPESDAWIHFPFNEAGIDFPDHVTVTSGTLRLTPTVAQVGNVTIEIHKIADADEGWIETTLGGVGTPATTGLLMSFAVAAAAVDVQVTLLAAVLSEMQRKINAGVSGMTFVLKMQTALGLSTFNSREAPSSETPVHTSGPLLRFCFTSPLSGQASGANIALENGDLLEQESGLGHLLTE